MSSLRVGLDVIAQPDNDDQKMYLAVIREVTKKEGIMLFLFFGWILVIARKIKLFG